VRPTISIVTDHTQLTDSHHWKSAIWALRCGYVEMLIVVTGLVLTLTNVTPWVLAGGLIAWLLTAVVLALEFLVARHEQPDPRLGFWQMRITLLSDSVHRTTRT